MTPPGDLCALSCNSVADYRRSLRALSWSVECGVWRGEAYLLAATAPARAGLAEVHKAVLSIDY
jgi:hypothetical protein